LNYPNIKIELKNYLKNWTKEIEFYIFSKKMLSTEESKRLKKIMTAGGAAGALCDLLFFPIDTIKTRLQSPQGFFKAGGFSRIYSGLPATIVGCVPGAAVFFGTYELTKKHLTTSQPSLNPTLGHIISAALAVSTAALVRVPVDNVKQKMQVTNETFINTIFKVRTLGIRGYWSSLLRDIPFSIVQFPLYEFMKKKSLAYKNEHYNNYDVEVPVQEAAVFGSLSGGVASVVTTPVDVVKTRLILINDIHGVPYKNALDVAMKIAKYEGKGAFFAGLTPRMGSIMVSSILYFGTYEGIKRNVQF
jgi:solute carrier family 25 S-adenosylmethionine transporter 26